MVFPPPLQEIIRLFSGLAESERRELLISFADQAPHHAPAETETFVLEEVRRDTECSDTVGVFLNISHGQRVQFRVALGSQVQTLTRAMTAILCQGLNGAPAREILAVPAEIVPQIVGADLVRLRSRTVYYLLGRMKVAVQHWLDLERAAQ